MSCLFSAFAFYGIRSGPRSSSTACPLRRLPSLDLFQRPAGAAAWTCQAASLFVDEILVGVPHAPAIVGGIGLVVPLLEPGEQFQQARQERNQARIFAATEAFLDVDVVGAIDRASCRWS